jgi:hypothetical protein
MTMMVLIILVLLWLVEISLIVDVDAILIIKSSIKNN